jgi:CelD/BcsL family acetyltransferase involved in cellulose biosynthesis
MVIPPGNLPAANAELRLEPISGFADARREWTELADRAGNVFGTWEWASIWWRHFGGDRMLRLMACRRAQGQLVAILPLYLGSSGPVRVARLVGHGAADELGPICQPGDRALAAQVIRPCLDEALPGWHLFVGDDFPPDPAWSELEGARSLRQTPSPVLRIDGSSWEELLASRGAHFRQKVRWQERRLAREHRARYRLAGDKHRLQADLDTLFALHDARWGQRGSGQLTGPRAGFIREFATYALERGWLRLWFLELNGSAVAAWLGFRFGAAEWHYQSGRDPAWDRYSVGFVLLGHTIREAMTDGMSEYRFLRGAESYKDRFANRELSVGTIGIFRGIAGRTSLAIARRALALPPTSRRRLARAIRTTA